MRQFLTVLGAGGLGGLAFCVALYFSSYHGVHSALGVKMYGSLQSGFIYPRIVWGALAGLFFLLPIAASTIFTRSIMISLIVSAIILCLIYPFFLGIGFLGLERGLLMPLVTWFLVWIGSLTSSILLRLA